MIPTPIVKAATAAVATGVAAATVTVQVIRWDELVSQFLAALPAIASLATVILTLWVKRGQDKLHTMVNSQQSTLNDIARKDATAAAHSQGLIEGAAGVRAELDKKEIEYDLLARGRGEP